jgi:hypothetical protein
LHGEAGRTILAAVPVGRHEENAGKGRQRSYQ